MASRQLQAIHSLTSLPWELRNFKRQACEAEDAALSPALRAALMGLQALAWLGEATESCPTGNTLLPLGMEKKQKFRNLMSILEN